MNSKAAPSIPIDRLTWNRLFRGIRIYIESPDAGAQAKRRFAALIGLMFALNGLNVVNSYVGRDFFTAIEHRSMSGFVGWALAYVGVFAVLTVSAVIFRYCEESLGLHWREWLTRRLIGRYLDHHVYYRIDTSGEVANPDQRMTDDVRAFTVTTLSFLLMVMNASFTVVAFSGVLWSISPLLFLVAVLYAALGSYLTIVLGRPLVGLSYGQLDKEAAFRADLVHICENAESVALLHREHRMLLRLSKHFGQLVTNFQEIIRINRNLGYFTTGYNYLIQIIPALVVAPLFIHGEVEFGVIAQAAIAFSLLLGAFSLIVTNFQSISAYAAVITRVGTLSEAIEGAAAAPAPTCGYMGEEMRPIAPTAIQVCEDKHRLAYEGLTLYSPHDGHVLISNLTASVPEGMRLLILGPNDPAKLALLRTTAGMWEHGEGNIVRPDFGNIFFLPERPYMPPGTLRELLVRTGWEDRTADDELLNTLRTLGLESLVERAEGLDTEQDWDDLLSLREQQMIAFSRLLLARPKFVVLDRVTTSLPPEDVTRMLNILAKYGITYVTIGRTRHGRRDTDDRLENYDAVLQIDAVGDWVWKSVKNGEIVENNRGATPL
ncbi:ABC transporter ATP-binding protein/permease [Methylococcus sp. EFPC2]|uniref:ABC transporter ATP-binding protein/permease n=1 Tax=Methylococcus sp. EFPC2 TaxID=2812648 RepID=UPI0019671010|nr:SbmA/BacA-like family transporter [Methylococcus sp. EFPC2]QSA98632.1 ABC transporter ATP-binding protein/permease [Methylococcus sp. EFPC2]